MKFYVISKFITFLRTLKIYFWFITNSSYTVGLRPVNLWNRKTTVSKVVIQGKLFQWCPHLLYCSVLCLGGNVNTRRLSKPDMGSIFHKKNQWNILVIGNFNYVNYQNYQDLMLLTSSDTKRTLMHLSLFTNSAQRELVSICTQIICNCN